MGNLFQELKRRKVFRVAAVYAVVAWLLIEVTSTILPTFASPAWVNQTFTLLLILGFPIALILSWAYEVTPEGIRTDVGTQPAASTTQSTDRNLIYLILGLVVLVVGFQISDRFIGGVAGPEGALTQIGSTTNSSQSVRFDINLGTFGRRPNSSMFNDVAISPDGTLLAYTGQTNGITRLYTRNLLTPDSSILVDSGGPYPFVPIFSPSGENILFQTAVSAELRFIHSNGTQTQLVTAGAQGFGGNWLTDQSIVFTAAHDLLLHEVPLSGGESRPLAIPHLENEQQSWAEIIPGQQWLLYTVTSLYDFNNGRIDAYNLVTGEAKTVVSRGYHASFASSGHVVFLRDGDLWAAPIDPTTAQLRGAEVLIERNIEHHSEDGKASYSFSDAGRLVYQEGGDGTDTIPAELTLLDGSGEAQLHKLPTNAFHATFSPNGENLAVTIRPPGLDSYIAVYNIANGTLARVSFAGKAQTPIWTADGKQLAYNVEAESGWELWLRYADGSGQPELLISSPRGLTASAFSPDGRRLVFTQGLGGKDHIRLISLDDRETPARDLITDSTDQWSGMISPDSRWIAYTSAEPEGYRVYVRPFPNVEGGRWWVPSSGGISREPLWGENGKALYYIDDGTLRRIAVNTDSGFGFGESVALFDLIWTAFDTPNFALSPDSQNLLYRAPPESGGTSYPRPTSLVSVENWFEKLKRLAPPDPQ